MRLLCSAPRPAPCPAPQAWEVPCGAAPGYLWRAQAVVTSPWCWDAAAADRGPGHGLEQGTIPILGSVQELPPVLQPRGHRREPKKSGNAQGLPHGPPGSPACTARPGGCIPFPGVVGCSRVALEPLGALLALPGLLQPPWAPLRPGMGVETGMPMENREATGVTGTHPTPALCQQNPHHSRVWVRFSHFFPNFSSRSHRDLCRDL